MHQRCYHRALPGSPRSGHGVVRPLGDVGTGPWAGVARQRSESPGVGTSERTRGSSIGGDGKTLSPARSAAPPILLCWFLVGRAWIGGTGRNLMASAAMSSGRQDGEVLFTLSEVFRT